jgi:1-deoxy-D-xylulose-5-phosphate synthase
MAAETGCLLTVEDHVRTGGFGSAVLEFFHSRKERPPRIAILGFPDQFIEHGSIEKLHAKYGLDAAGIERAALELLEREPHGNGKRLAHAEGQKK